MKATLTSGAAKSLAINRICGVVISNISDVTIYVGDSPSVDADNGYPIPAGQSFQLKNPYFERGFHLPGVFAYQESGSDKEIYYESSRGFPISAATEIKNQAPSEELPELTTTSPVSTTDPYSTTDTEL